MFEPEYIHLINFFLLPPETTASEEPDPLVADIGQLFYQSRDSKLGTASVLGGKLSYSYIHVTQILSLVTDTSYQAMTTKMCHAAAVTVAAVLGSPAGCNPLWFYLFAADELQHTSTSNLAVSHHHFIICSAILSNVFCSCTGVAF